MANSQKQFDTDAEKIKAIEALEAPIDIVNIIVRYDSYENLQELTPTAIPCVSASSSSSSSSSSSTELKHSPVVGVNSYTSSSSHGNVPLISTLFNSIKTARLKQLLTASVSGKPDEVKALLDQDPSLVLEKLPGSEFVMAPTGHKFNLKPYQAALSVDDTQTAKLIKSYIKDEKEADRQYNEQCPEGWIDAENKKWQPIFAQLNKLTLAISKNKPGDDITSSGNPNYIVTVKNGSLVEKELQAFWDLLDATKNEIITVGKKPFNPQVLLTAWKTYDDEKCYRDYFGGNWNDPRALLFWQKVIGYDGIQRCMPVNYVQAFHDWLEETVKKLQNDQPQDRATQFQIYRSGSWVPMEFYPLQARGSSDFNFAVYGFACVRRFGQCSREAGFRNLCQSKAACAQSLHSTETSGLSHQTRPGLV